MLEFIGWILAIPVALIAVGLVWLGLLALIGMKLSGR
jgi:hypothetical protein